MASKKTPDDSTYQKWGVDVEGCLWGVIEYGQGQKRVHNYGPLPAKMTACSKHRVTIQNGKGKTTSKTVAVVKIFLSPSRQVNVQQKLLTPKLDHPDFKSVKLPGSVRTMKIGAFEGTTSV